MFDFCHTQKRQQHFENGIGEAGGLLGELVSYSEVFMLLGNSRTVDEREHTKIDSELSYSPSLEAALNRVLGDPAFLGERATPSFKFIRAARFLKDNAPHAFQIREMGTPATTAWTVGSGTCWTEISMSTQGLSRWSRTILPPLPGPTDAFIIAFGYHERNQGEAVASKSLGAILVTRRHTQRRQERIDKSMGEGNEAHRT